MYRITRLWTIRGLLALAGLLVAAPAVAQDIGGGGGGGDGATTACADNEIWKASSNVMACAADSTGGTPSFDAVTTGTNTTGTLTCNSGCTIDGTGAFSMTGDVAAWLLAEADNLVFWDSSQASRTITFGLSGATDPVLTIADGAINLTTGVFRNGGVNMPTVSSTSTFTNKTILSAGNVIEADTTIALASNGANCSAGSGALGVDASGASESCTDFEEDLANSAGLLAALSDETGTGFSVFSASPTLTGTIEAAAANFSGAVTAPSFTADASASPSLTLKDSDTTAIPGDVNAQLTAQATDVGDGTEDIDVTIGAQIAGTMTTHITLDADGADLYDGAGQAIRLGDVTNYMEISDAGVVTFGGTGGYGDGTVAVADLAAGTDGQLITWDAAGAAAVVATGTATHVLTSNGAGAAPTFQAAAGGSAPDVGMWQPDMTFKSTDLSAEPTGSNDGWCYRVPMPVGIATLGTMTVYVGTVGAAVSDHHLALYSGDGQTQYFEANIDDASTVGVGYESLANELTPGAVPAGDIIACYSEGSDGTLRLAAGMTTGSTVYTWYDADITFASGEPPDTISVAGFAFPTGSLNPFWFALED